VGGGGGRWPGLIDAGAVAEGSPGTRDVVVHHLVQDVCPVREASELPADDLHLLHLFATMIKPLQHWCDADE
jgi:hypothetical protein